MKRGRIVSIAIAALAVIVAVVFHARIAAWFSPPAQSQAQAAADAGAIDYWTCPMHPSVHAAGPGQCPICGMTLVPVTKEQQSEGVITIDDERRQKIGVRTAKVTLAPMHRTVRAVGKVTYDESRLTDVSLKVRGWITKLWANETGARVTRGQPLFSLYSPELEGAQKDFLVASPGDAGPSIPGLPAASRERLRLLGMSDPQIATLAQKKTVIENVVFTAPASGVIVDKAVVEGASVEAGMRVMRIAAIDRVWIEADVYESDLPNVQRGQRAQVTLDYVPGRAFDATVSYVYPYLDTAARTGRVRFDLDNRDATLRPGMYANVELESDLGTRLQVPASAVVYTGPRRLVFVDLGQGKFKPQEIQVGVESGGMVEVLSGLKDGDVIATSGVFLVAAEARIATATKYWESSP